MRTLMLSGLSLVAVGCLAAPVLAQPVQREQEVTEVGAPAQAPAEGPVRFRVVEGSQREVRLEKGAYLGVATSAPPRALRQQLQLPNGIGLVVDFVAPKSPAEEAGLKQYDVLHKLDDQLLVNQQQLAVLVRSHKGGDEVKLTVIRRGKSETITAKLGEKDLPPLDELRMGDAEQMHREIERMLPPNVIVAPPPPGGQPVPPGRRILIRPEGPGGGMVFLAPDGSKVVANSLTITLDDGHGSLTINNNDGHSHLLAKDKDGKVLFDGPIDTEQQRQAMPKEVREKLEKMGPTFAPAPEGKQPGAPSSKDGDEKKEPGA